MTTLLTLHDPAAARTYYAKGLWRQDTLYSLVRDHAAARPDAFALRDARRRLTWRDLLRWIDVTADALHEAGVRKGQRVSVWLPNSTEAVVAFVACSRNGYVCNPSLHRNYTVAEIVGLVKRLRSAALFVEPGYGADADRHDIVAATRELSFLKRVFLRGSDFPPADGPARNLVEPDLNPDKICYLAFTSGTTGEPKGVMHSDNTLLANGRPMVEDWSHGPDTVLYSLSPLSHHIGTVAVEQALVAGAELVVDDLPAGTTRYDRIVETGATYVMGVPTHAMDILGEMRRRGTDSLGNVSVFYMAGAPIPPETAQGFLKRGITPQNIYGMTENGSHQYTLPSDGAQTIVETCGRACSGYEIRIWDAENPDTEVPQGTVGEIGGRGACLMLGYFDNQQATEDSYNARGWFMSGDLGRIDENGCLQIMGRKKDLIIRGGHNIHPTRIEDLALKHPAVAKAAAFAVADERLGEKVCLAVLLHEDEALAGDDALAHLDAVGLSKFDMPEYYLVMEAFPLTASGKIMKRVLVDWTREGRIAPQPVRWQPNKQRETA